MHLNSAVYHCYAAHSEATAARLLRYDLAGIGFFILVCMVNGVIHAFRCTPAWRTFYLVTQTTLGLLTLATPLFPHWLPMLQSHSAVVKLYTAVVCSGLIPAAHWLFCVATPMEWTLIFPRVVGFFAWLGVGLAFYLTRFPESRWPGRFDVVSHLGCPCNGSLPSNSYFEATSTVGNCLSKSAACHHTDCCCPNCGAILAGGCLASILALKR